MEIKICFKVFLKDIYKIRHDSSFSWSSSHHFKQKQHNRMKIVQQEKKFFFFNGKVKQKYG